MPHDPVKVEETRSWFDKARYDLRAASVDMEAEPPLLEDALFHCQQAVEKAMKGFLSWHDQPFRKTHSLSELGVMCIQLDPKSGEHPSQNSPLVRICNGIPLSWGDSASVPGGNGKCSGVGGGGLVATAGEIAC